MINADLKTVALVGRPNVGKSTLFNRLVGKRMAIETPVPGTTRDRLFAEVTWQDKKFNLVDLAGIETGSKKQIDKSIQEGTALAIENADLILFLVDWNEPHNEMDKFVARKLRAYKDRVILVVNKADNAERQREVEIFKRLGEFPIVPVSAISGKGSGDLLEEISKRLPKEEEKETEKKTDIAMAIIGRPNVGKSTLLNAILGEKRSIVSEQAGTTRDIVEVVFAHKGKQIEIVDTAGIRRPGKIEKDTIESFSVLRTYSALHRSDIAVLVIDAAEGLVALDMNILGEAIETGKGIILAVNKIDLVPGDKQEYMAKMIWELQSRLNFAPWLPIVFISALDEENINPLLNQVVTVAKSRGTEISQDDLDKILESAKGSNMQLFDIKRLYQKKTNPPVFEIAFPAKKKPHFTQVRYLENKIRDIYPMSGTPIYIDLKGISKNFGR